MALFFDHEHSLLPQLSYSSENRDSERILLYIRIFLLIKIELMTILHGIEYISVKLHRIFDTLDDVEYCAEGTCSSNARATVNDDWAR